MYSAGHAPTGPLELVDLLGRPLGTLVGFDGEVGDLVLLDQDGNLSDAAIDIGCDYTEALFDGSHDPAQSWLPAWAWQRAEQIQRAVFDSLISTGNEQDYTATRRFLIEHPAGDERELVNLMNDVRAHQRAVRFFALVPVHRYRSAIFTVMTP